MTASTGPARRGGRLDFCLGLALAVGLTLLGARAAGGTELGANTWIQVVLIVLGAGMALAVLLAGATGPRWGAGTLLAFVALSGLTYLSITWSVQPATSWLEADRTLSYLAAFGAAMAVARLSPRRWPALLGAVAASTTALSLWALVLKVFPGALDQVDQLGRLIEPLDYWNAVGLMAAMGIAPCLWAGTREEGGRWMKALAAPAIALLVATILLSYSRGALIIAVLSAVCWFLLVPLRLRGALILAIGVVGGAVISAWALPNHALSADYVPLAQRISAGKWLGLVIVLVLIGCGVTGWITAGCMQRVALSARIRRQLSLALLGLAALAPMGGLVALAASSRGFTGEVSHIWGTLTNTHGGTGDQPGRLAELSNSRPHYWGQGLTVGGHHVLVGAGALGFATANRRYSHDAQPVAHAHSYVVETFADFGLLGLAISLLLLGCWARAAARPLRGPPRAGERSERFGMATLLCVVLTFGLHSLIDWTWFIPGTAVIALICAGWLAGRGPLDSVVGWATRFRRPSQHPHLGVVAVALTALTVLAVWVVLAPWRSANADSAAISDLVRGHAGAALTQARAAASRYPVSVDPLFLLSTVYGAERNPALARDELVQAARLQPANPAVWQQLGAYDLAHHLPSSAAAELERAHALDLGSAQIAAQLQEARAAAAKSG